MSGVYCTSYHSCCWSVSLCSICLWEWSSRTSTSAERVRRRRSGPGGPPRGPKRWRGNGEVWTVHLQIEILLKSNDSWVRITSGIASHLCCGVLQSGRWNATVNKIMSCVFFFLLLLMSSCIVFVYLQSHSFYLENFFLFKDFYIYIFFFLVPGFEAFYEQIFSLPLFINFRD